MKISRLDLLAYGPFTSESLVFPEAGRGLHLVYGPNEAGKSTTLRALRGVLFGIPNQCIDDFLHPGPALRVGAVLHGECGAFACIRRRGARTAKGTLRGADDEEILEVARLEELLSGVDEQAFQQRFGIDYKTLVAGGREIIEGKGDLGKILFAAASGAANLGKVLKNLDESASELFLPRGIKPPLNAALSALKEIKKRRSHSELTVREWQTKQDELEAAQEKCRLIQESLRAAQASQRQMEAYLKIRPDLEKRKLRLQELAEIQHTPLLNEEFSPHRQARQAARIKVCTEEETARSDLERDSLILKQLVVPEELLIAEATVQSLRDGFAKFNQADQDRVGLVAERDQLVRQAEQLRQELVPHAPQRLRLKKVERVLLQSLAGDYQALVQNVERGRKQVEKTAEKIARLEASRVAAAAPLDPAALKRVIKRAAAKADAEHQLEVLAQEQLREQKKLATGISRLGLWSGDIAQLVDLQLPPPESLEKFDQHLRLLGQQLATARQKLAETNASHAEKEIVANRLRRSGAVLTNEDLQTARERRDAGWRLVLKRLRGLAAADDEQGFLTLFPGSDDLASAYAASVHRADEAADRLRREATQVVELENLQTDLQKLSARRGPLEAELADWERQWAAAEGDWQALWKPLAIRPLSPSEMRGFCTRAAELIRQAETFHAAQADLARQRELVDSLRAELRQALAENGAADLAAKESLAELQQRLEDLVKAIEKDHRDQEKRDDELLKERQLLAEIWRECAEAESQLTNWRESWQRAVEPLGLSPETSPVEINSLLATADDYFGKLGLTGEKEERIAGIDARAAAFTQELRETAGRIAADLVESPAEIAVPRIAARFQEARAADDRRRHLQAQVELHQRRLEDSQRGRKVLEEQLALMCTEAGCERQEELAAAESQSASRRRIEEELRGIQDRVHQFAESSPVEDFIDAALAKTADEWRGELADATRKVTELEQEQLEQVKAAQDALHALKSMDGNESAAQADEEAQLLLAQIRAQAEQYARLKLASLLLRQAMERYRDKNQGPVLERASQLFAELTLGSFAALRPGFDEQGEPVLVGIRPDGQEVMVAGMSDGTCDQLYLALRLASLEVYLRQNRPIPFIVDDILINFDDERAGAALRALAQLAQQTQVIFFTHHEHLLRLAEERLDREEYAIHFLAALGRPL